MSHGLSTCVQDHARSDALPVPVSACVHSGLKCVAEVAWEGARGATQAEYKIKAEIPRRWFRGHGAGKLHSLLH